MTAPRLSDATLARADPLVLRPAYQRSETRIGVVHFGPGAFHRAHQAFYLDRMLARDPGLAICAVSLRSDDLRAALSPQDGLYALAECDAAPSLRVRWVMAPMPGKVLKATSGTPIFASGSASR